MQVILKSDVDHLGFRGDVVDVKRGYWRNYLRPRGFAETATADRVAEMTAIMDRRRELEARTEQEAHELRDMLSRTAVTITAQAGEQGKLFGSVGVHDIARAVENTRKLRVDPKKIKLDEPIKQLGTYAVAVNVFTGVDADLTVVVAAAEENEAEVARLKAAAEAEVAEAIRLSDAALEAEQVAAAAAAEATAAVEETATVDAAADDAGAEATAEPTE